MKPHVLGEVVAEQDFELLAADGARRAVKVRLGRPVRDPDSPARDWTCPYQITGVGNERVKIAVGLDSAHALSLALHMFPVELLGLVEGEGGELTYLGQAPVFFGGLCQTLLRNT